MLTASTLVDGPALEWLAKQNGPRIWISDGSVTGIGDSQAANLFMEAGAILRKGNIRRFGSVDDFVEYAARRMVKH